MSHQSNLIAEDIDAYLLQHEQKELLRLLTCGSVDDGKSTLIGRLLHDTKMIYEDTLAALQKDSAKMGTTGEKLDLALLVDGLQAEREQGITIDVAYRYFSTEKRKFIVADTPGHEQYTRNMATGASTAQLAIILIDARYGVLTQTRRHSFIASLLGIHHIVVAVNKMDLVDYSEARFEEIRRDYLKFSSQLDLQDIHFVPMSALDGDNVVHRSEKMPWYSGTSLMEIMETVEIARDKNLTHFRFPVQYVNRPNLDFRGFCGTIASGRIKPGDLVMALPSRKTSHVERIVTFDGDLDEAYVDQAITLTLTDEIDVSRGDMLIKPGDEPHLANRFNAQLVWMAEDTLQPGKLYGVKMGPAFTAGSVRKIHHRIDVNSLDKQPAEALALNEIGHCDITLSAPLAWDAYGQNHATGAFILIDRLTNVTVGAGMITGPATDGEDLFSPVTAGDRSSRLAQQPLRLGCTGTQSTLLARALERRLFDLGKTAVVLDSAAFAQPEDAEVAINSLYQHGLIAIVTGQQAPDGNANADQDEQAGPAIKALIDALQQSRKL